MESPGVLTSTGDVSTALRHSGCPQRFARRGGGGCWANEAEISVGTTVGMSTSRFQQANEIYDFIWGKMADHRSAALESRSVSGGTIKLL